jgi:PAS domain S-box-containing protein
MSITDHLAEAILETQSDAIHVADRSGVIRFWNPGAVRIFGFTAPEAIGQPLDLIIPENLRARHQEGYDRVMAGGATRYGSGDILAVPALTKGGRRISIEFTIIVLRDSDNATIGMAAILRDVTSRFEEMRSLRRRVAELDKSKPTIG